MSSNVVSHISVYKTLTRSKSVGDGVLEMLREHTEFNGIEARTEINRFV